MFVYDRSVRHLRSGLFVKCVKAGKKRTQKWINKAGGGLSGSAAVDNNFHILKDKSSGSQRRVRIL